MRDSPRWKYTSAKFTNVDVTGFNVLFNIHFEVSQLLKLVFTSFQKDFNATHFSKLILKVYLGPYQITIMEHNSSGTHISLFNNLPQS